jgi:hypothetical protein
VAVRKPSISRTEWDFRRVQDSAVVGCYYYEFAREVARETPEFVVKVERLQEVSAMTPEELLAEGEAFAAHLSSEDILAMLRPHLESTSAHVLENYSFLRCSEWPRTPYLEIDKNFRKPSDEELAAKLRPPRPPIYLEPDVSSNANWPKADPSKIEIVIPPWMTHDEALEAFAALLRVDFPKQGKASGNRRNPQGRASGLATKRQDLKASGIHRLMNHYGHASQVLTFLESEKKPPYHSTQALYRVRKDARETIAEFKSETIFHLDKALARHKAMLASAAISMKHFRQL